MTTYKDNHMDMGRKEYHSFEIPPWFHWAYFPKPFFKFFYKGLKETWPFTTISSQRSHWRAGTLQLERRKIWTLNWQEKHLLGRQWILTYNQILESLPFSFLDFQHSPELWTWWHAVHFPAERRGFYNTFNRQQVTKKLKFWLTAMKYVDSVGPWESTDPKSITTSNTVSDVTCKSSRIIIPASQGYC